MAEFYFDVLRHGACVGGNIFRGHNDVLLTDDGYACMEASIARISGKHWQAVISSPLLRCYIFAQNTASFFGLPLNSHAGIKEISFGAWEGRKIEEVWESDKKVIHQWSQDPSTITPLKGEPLEVFSKRIILAIKALAEKHNGQRVLMVTHGGVIRVLYVIAQSLAWHQSRELSVPFASLLRFRWSTQDGLTLIDNLGGPSL